MEKVKMTKEQKLELCKYLNITVCTLWRWETGRTKVPQAAKLALSGWVNIPNFLKCQESITHDSKNNFPSAS
jgi:DNA-binding transcriptional regulator YiaG